MASEEDIVETLVVDSAAFLKNIPLQKIAKNVYTIREVISEIKSAAVREKLAVLPYEIKFRVPSNESLHVVSEFAKKTGDFRSLSIVDLNVLALTFQLHKEKCGTETLRDTPTKQVEVVDKQQQGKIPGFFVKPKNFGSKETSGEIENANEEISQREEEQKLVEQIEDCSLFENGDKDIVKPDEDSCVIEMENEQNKQMIDEKHLNYGEKDNLTDANDNRNNDDDDDFNDDNGGDHTNNDDGEDDNDDGVSNDYDREDFEDGDQDNYTGDNYDDSDDDSDWITPDNIAQVKADLGILEHETKPSNVAVGCLTTDFAMQNVLIQMGLHVISVDGMLIKEARSYVLKCYSCFKITTQMQRLFCPNCGNRTLLKVAVSVDENGITRYHMSKRKKPFVIRGKKHPLPLPKGGRYSNNPLLFEDQLISQKRLPKVKDKVNVLDQDYVARSSPFAVNDTTSRAFNLGFHIHSSKRHNPNEARKKTRRKKK